MTRRGSGRAEYLSRPYHESPLLEFLDVAFHPDWHLDDLDAKSAVRSYLNSQSPKLIASLDTDLGTVIDQFGDRKLRALVGKHLVALSDADRLGLDLPQWLLWLRQQLPADPAVARARFAADKERVMASAVPSSGDNLLGMAIDFDALFEDSDILQDITVRRTENKSCLLEVAANAKGGISPEVITAEVEWLWLGLLRYRYFESHFLRASDTSVILEFLTQMSPQGLYVTGEADISILLPGPKSDAE